MGGGVVTRSCALAHFHSLTLVLLLAALCQCTGGQLRVACHGYWNNGGGSGNCTRHLPVRLLSQRLGFTVVSVVPEDSPDLLFVSVFSNLNETKQLLRASAAVRVYVTGENADDHEFEEGELDLALGYRCPSSQLHPLRYGALRIPCIIWGTNWMPRYVSDDCKLRLGEVSSENKDVGPAVEAEWMARPCFAALIVRHGGYPREALFNAFTQLGLGAVEAPSTYLHNSEFLKDDDLPVAAVAAGYEADLQKLLHLRRCRFSICPENSAAEGYVTEKVFDSLAVGSVPVYWGPPVPLPEVLNSHRILNLALLPEHKGAEAGVTPLQLIAAQAAELVSNTTRRREFFSQPVMAPTAQRAISYACGSLVDHVQRLLEARRGLTFPARSQARD